MNRKIGMWGAMINLCSVLGFALCMILGTNFASYLSSIFIAWSFVLMLCAFVYYADDERRVAGFCAVVFGGMYAICNSIVYFTQITTLRTATLTDQAARLLDFQRYELFFSYDMLGYCLMAVATFFAGLTIAGNTRTDKWLKRLLLIHGVFSISCFIMPMLGLFHADMQGGDWIGMAVLEFWCAYFLPVGILSFLHFRDKPQ